MAEGVTFTYPSPDEYLIVTMTPTQPGATRMTDVTFRYDTDRSDWYRRGTERVKLDVSVRTGPH